MAFNGLQGLLGMLTGGQGSLSNAFSNTTQPLVNSMAAAPQQAAIQGNPTGNIGGYQGSPFASMLNNSGGSQYANMAQAYQAQQGAATYDASQLRQETMQDIQNQMMRRGLRTSGLHQQALDTTGSKLVEAQAAGFGQNAISAFNALGNYDLGYSNLIQQGNEFNAQLAQESAAQHAASRGGALGAIGSLAGTILTGGAGGGLLGMLMNGGGGSTVGGGSNLGTVGGGLGGMLSGSYGGGTGMLDGGFSNGWNLMNYFATGQNG